jgi:hydrogenase-4 component B
VLGVLYALMQHDLKRLLAYQHGREHRHHLHRPRPGAGLPGQRHDGAAAALALTAALFHVFNHSLFKSLLFFGAGAVLTRHRRARHGSARRADPPHAGDQLRFLVGCVAISACRRSTASCPNG